MPQSSSKAVQNYTIYVKPSWFRKNWIELSTIIGGLIAINLIFIANTYTETNTLNSENAAQLGDFVGGYIGTIFALISVVFLYSTLKNQRETATIEKFETKYFELLKLHRDNVSEIQIGKDSGKKIFVAIIREFREILKITRDIAKLHRQKLSKKELFIISYNVLFLGVGPNSSRMLLQSLSDYDSEFVKELESTLNQDIIKNKIKLERKFKFTPFEGHQSRLGHYYRNLYQTVSYVDKQKIDIDKYEYTKTIRAQLSTHEQALLLINSLAPIGEAWWSSKMILRYKMVKNIPFSFFDTESEINLEEMFPSDYFEYQKKKLQSQ